MQNGGSRRRAASTRGILAHRFPVPREEGGGSSGAAETLSSTHPPP